MRLRNIILLALVLLAFTAPSWAIGIAGSAGGKRVTVSVDGTWQGTYAAGTTYALGAIVTDGTTNYRSLQSSNTGHTPASSPTYWQVILVKGDTGPTGATGSQGPAGAAGIDGRTVLTTSGAPSAGTGANGDYAYDPATYLMYGPKSGGAWPNGVLLKGADGAGFTGGTDGTYGWLTDSNTSAYSECASGKYGLNFVGGVLYQCSNGANSVFTSGDSLPTQTGNSGKYLTTNGTTASWGTIAAGSGIAISTDIPTEAGVANLNDSTHVLTVASSTGYTQFTGSFTAWDTTPDAFSFTDETGIAINTAKTSNAITVAGINYPAAISVTGDTGFGYSKNSAACTATSGTVVAGDTVAACVTSSGSNSTATTATVTIGGVSDTYSVTTAAGGASTYLINQNFETVSTGYDNGETWTPTIGSGGAITPNYTTDPLVGNQSMYMSAATVVVSNKSPVFSAQTELYGYFAFKIAATPTTSTTILEIKGDAGTGTTSIVVHTDGKIKMYHGTTAVYTTAAVTAGTQYYVWYRTKQGSGSDGVYQLWLSTSSVKPATPDISGTNGTSTSNYTYIRPQINYNNNIIFDRILTGAESIGSDPS